MNRTALFTIFLLSLAAPAAAALADNTSAEADKAPGTDKPAVAKKTKENLLGPGPSLKEYDEIVTPDLESASSLNERSRVALRNGNVSRALALSKRALKMEDNDPDIHMNYALAMEAKLDRQAEKDPDLFKSCVREWLTVYRNETGEERGMTYKGLNIIGTWWNDDYRGGTAKKHLKKLVGYVPKAWETDNKFMAKASKPATATVQGSLRDKDKDKNDGEK